jgi:hypothetical protein
MNIFKLYHHPKTGSRFSEKGRFVDIIQKNNLETVLPHIQGRDSSEVSEVLNPLLSQENLNYYHDKRLIRICQVPQMPYLEKDIVTGIWKPTKETVEAVKKEHCL